MSICTRAAVSIYCIQGHTGIMFNYEDIKKEGSAVTFLLDAYNAWCGIYLKLLGARSGACDPSTGRNGTEVRRQFAVAAGAIQARGFKNRYQEHHVYE